MYKVFEQPKINAENIVISELYNINNEYCSEYYYSKKMQKEKKKKNQLNQRKK